MGPVFTLSDTWSCSQLLSRDGFACIGQLRELDEAILSGRRKVRSTDLNPSFVLPTHNVYFSVLKVLT